MAIAPAPVRLSVIICTHQRARDLSRALESLVAQTGVHDGVEILVVDNRSTDDTRQVAERFQTTLPIRYVYEQQLGLCHARNRGWREAAAPIVAYLDDDAVACGGWIEAIVRAFDEHGPNVGCVGGRVIPEWEAPQPQWLSHQVSLALTIVDWSPTPHLITDLRVEWLVGANVAFRVEALAAAGGFDPRLDRAGSRLLSSGDVFMVKQVMRRGYSCLYHPAMSVRHRVPAERLTQRWFRHRYYWQGISDAAMEIIEHSPSRSQRLRSALSRAVTLVGSPGRLLALARSTDDAAEFEAQCWTWIALGHVAGLLGAAG
jgi:glucosyl-dolichyl phosphate glucuronosyltransferase